MSCEPRASELWWERGKLVSGDVLVGVPCVGEWVCEFGGMRGHWRGGCVAKRDSEVGVGFSGESESPVGCVLPQWPLRRR